MERTDSLYDIGLAKHGDRKRRRAYCGSQYAMRTCVKVSIPRSILYLLVVAILSECPRAGHQAAFELQCVCPTFVHVLQARQSMRVAIK